MILYVLLFLMWLFCGTVYAVVTAVFLVDGSEAFLVSFPTLLVSARFSYRAFWWAIFRMRFDSYRQAWHCDNTLRYSALQEAKTHYEDGNLEWAFYFLKKAEKADLTHYRN